MYLEFRLVDLEDGGEPWAVITSIYLHSTDQYRLTVARDGKEEYVTVSDETYKLIYGDANPPRTFMLVDDEVTLDIWDKTQKCDNCGWPMSDHKGKNQERCPLPGEPDEDEEEPEK